MRVSWDLHENRRRLEFRLDPEESTTAIRWRGGTVGMVTNSCHFRLPQTIDPPHPDLAAAVAMTIANPWVGKRITFDRAISLRLAEELAESFDLDVGPIDRSLAERKPGAQIGLSYSGGVDSIAVGELLPPESPHIHLERVRHPRVPNRATHFRADVSAHLVREAGRRGRNVSIVETDLEYILHPYPSYPEWTAIGTGVLLLADSLDLGGVAFGTVLGAGYLDNGLRFYPRPFSNKWERLFAAVGLPYVRPGCGISEVSTTRLAQESDLGDIARSCVLGTLDGPCMNCMKCLRKDLTSAALEGRPLDPLLLHNLDDQHEVVLELLQPPPYHQQHILEYGLARVPGIDRTFLAAATAYLEPSRESTSWVDRFYPPALEQDIPEAWRGSVKRQLQNHMQWMSPDDIGIVESWDAAGRAVPQRRA